MNKFKNFDIEKAQKLCLEYEEKQCYEEEQFVRALIAYQGFLPNKSIVCKMLALGCYFNQSTVETVLEDLKYKLVFYNYYTRLYDVCTDLFFIPDNFNFAEG